jgi:hypothetical protein
MEPKLAALKALLDELDLPPAISTLQDRKLIQKGVLLGQTLGGVDLGYSYSWYIRGPYSTQLAKSYYELDHALRVEPDEKRQLPSSARVRLQKLRPLLKVPAGVDLTQPDWLELLASVVYLGRERGLDNKAIEALIRKEKAHLADHLSDAYQALAKAA